MSSNCLLWHHAHLLYVWNKTPDSGFCDYLMSFSRLFTWPSLPLCPTIPQYKSPVSLGGSVFFGQVLIYADVLECVCVFCQWATLLLWLKTSRRRLLSHFWKKKNWLLFQWPYSSCVVFFSPDLYIKNLFVPWKTNQFAEINLWYFEHGIFPILTALYLKEDSQWLLFK